MRIGSAVTKKMIFVRHVSSVQIEGRLDRITLRNEHGIPRSFLIMHGLCTDVLYIKLGWK